MKRLLSGVAWLSDVVTSSARLIFDLGRLLIALVVLGLFLGCCAILIFGGSSRPNTESKHPRTSRLQDLASSPYATAHVGKFKPHGTAERSAVATAHSDIRALATRNATVACALMTPATQAKTGKSGGCRESERQIMKLGWAGGAATWNATQIVGAQTNGSAATVAVRGPVDGEPLFGTISLRRARDRYLITGDDASPLPLTPDDKLVQLPGLSFFDASDRGYLETACSSLPFATMPVCATDYLRAAEHYLTGAHVESIAHDIPTLIRACESTAHATQTNCQRRVAHSLAIALR